MHCEPEDHEILHGLLAQVVDRFVDLLFIQNVLQTRGSVARSRNPGFCPLPNSELFDDDALAICHPSLGASAGLAPLTASCYRGAEK